jgi:hypothetical protein
VSAPNDDPGAQIGAGVQLGTAPDRPADLLAWSGLPSPGSPVFVGGCSRSGTTLLGAMLGVGRDHLTVPESVFKWELWGAGAVTRNAPNKDAVIDLHRARDYLAGDRMFKLWDVPLPDPAPRFVTFGSLLAYLVSSYGVRTGKPGTRSWVDHTPGNIRFVMTLRRSFPDARFLNLIRDGRAVAASVMPLDWGPNDAREAGFYWATQISAGLGAAHRLGPQVVRTLHYEDLVRTPETALEGVCEFLDIPYSHSMIDRRDYNVMAYEEAQQRLVASRPDPTRIDAWRGELTPVQIREFERATGELLEYLGYAADFGAGARRATAREHAQTLLLTTVRRLVVNKLRFRRRRARHNA